MDEKLDIPHPDGPAATVSGPLWVSPPHGQTYFQTLQLFWILRQPWPHVRKHIRFPKLQLSLALMDLACFHPLAPLITLSRDLPSPTIKLMNLAVQTQLLHTPTPHPFCNKHNNPLFRNMSTQTDRREISAPGGAPSPLSTEQAHTNVNLRDDGRRQETSGGNKTDHKSSHCQQAV